MRGASKGDDRSGFLSSHEEHCTGLVSGTPSPSQGLAAREGGHREEVDVSQRAKKELEELGPGEDLLLSYARLQLSESLANLRTGKDEGKTGKVTSRAIGVGDDVLGCEGGTGVTLLEMGNPFGGDVVLGGRPDTVRQNELGVRS